jgi:uncharacterized protein YndB with AHSA1/START domain
MSDIYHSFPIKAPLSKVFEGIATSKGLDNWWPRSSKGNPAVGAIYDFDFGPDYQWKAVITKCIPDQEFEMQFTHAMDDWMGAKVGFRLKRSDDLTWVYFYHTGWPDITDHYKISSYCWAMYLRILKRNLEFGETVPYEKRLDV